MKGGFCKMSETKKTIEGVIISVKFSGTEYTKNIFSKKIPYITFVIQEDSKKKSVELPIDISNPFELKQIENDLLNQQAVYKKGVFVGSDMYEPANITEEITIKSGKFKGVQYEHNYAF